MLLFPIFHNFMLVLSSLHLSHILSNLYVLIEQLKFILARKVVSRKILIQQKYISTTSIHCSIKVGKWKFSSASYHSSVWFLFHIIKPQEMMWTLCAALTICYSAKTIIIVGILKYIYELKIPKKQKYMIRMVRKIFQWVSMLLAKSQ